MKIFYRNIIFLSLIITTLFLTSCSDTSKSCCEEILNFSYTENDSLTKSNIEIAKNLLETREADLVAKKEELQEITKETELEEVELLKKSKEQEQFIEERYLTAYKRIRGAARNGLAVVMVDRDACGGCFNKIPHQRQMEIKMHKKVIVCEHCGRILVDQNIADKVSI